MTRGELIERILLEYGKGRVYGGRGGETTTELVQSHGGTHRYWMKKAPGRDTEFIPTNATGPTIKMTIPKPDKGSQKWQETIAQIMHGKK